jgi:hypothetical protein
MHYVLIWVSYRDQLFLKFLCFELSDLFPSVIGGLGGAVLSSLLVSLCLIFFFFLFFFCCRCCACFRPLFSLFFPSSFLPNAHALSSDTIGLSCCIPLISMTVLSRFHTATDLRVLQSKWNACKLRETRGRRRSIAKVHTWTDNARSLLITTIFRHLSGLILSQSEDTKWPFDGKFESTPEKKIFRHLVECFLLFNPKMRSKRGGISFKFLNCGC